MNEGRQRRNHVISKKTDSFFLKIHSAFEFAIRFFKEAFKPPYEFKEIIRQCYEVGYKSLPLITLTGFITGLVFTKQSRPSLADFGAASWLPSLVSIAIIRALAPLVTALICAGKVGSNIGAELGSMKVTEQIEDIINQFANTTEIEVLVSDHDAEVVRTLLEKKKKHDYVVLKISENLNPGEFKIDTKEEHIVKKFNETLIDFRRSVFFSDNKKSDS